LQTFLPRLLGGWSFTKGGITTDRNYTRLFTPLSPHTKQVHVVLSEVASNEVNVDDDVSSGDEDFEDEEDLSDTENEEEWDTPEPV